MRVLFLTPSQFRPWEQEPLNHEVRLPILASGVVTDHHAFDYKTVAMERGRAAMFAELRDLVRSFSPDLIIYGNTLRDWRLTPDELSSLRYGATRVLGVLWDSYDRPTDQEADFFYALDGLIVGDSLYAYARYRLLSEHHAPGKTIVFLPGHQVLPDVFSPGEGAKKHDVSHIGTLYGGRAAFVERLATALPAHRSVLQVGGLFDRREIRRIDNLILYDYAESASFLSLDAYASVMRESRCCLSLQSDPGSARVRGKTFEILASKALCIVEDIKQYRLLLPPDGMVPVATPEAAAQAVAALLDAPDELERIAGRGYEWFRDSFDVTAFWNDALEAALAGDTPELRYVEARRAYESLRVDLFAQYDGPPGEESLMKLIFS